MFCYAKYIARTATKPDMESFSVAWDAFFGSIRRARGRFASEAGAGELTLPQYQLVTALSEMPQRPIGELPEAAGIAPPTATRMLDGLERAGIVRRTPSTEDRRVVIVQLTAKGGRLLERKRKRVEERRRALYDSLSPTERDQAERLLHRLAVLMDEL
jgi:MarR family transcriptional regulator, organic hydroperoxide resistance regulator